MIQIDTMTDEGIISVDHCYLRVVTDGDSWSTHPNLQQATIERVGTQIALKKGPDDILVFTDNAQIKLNGDGLPANRDGNAIWVECTAIYAKITDEEITRYQNGDSIVTKSSREGYCVEQGTRKELRWAENDDNSIRVWITKYQNYLIRNILQMNVTFSEIVDTYENESGHTITYPVRLGKRRIDIKIEADLQGLEILMEMFKQPELLLFYKSPSDSCEQYGYFRKISDLQITTIARNPRFDNNPLLYQWQNKSPELSHFYPLDDGLQPHTGAYEFSVSLEEV
mgnify:FL=1